MPSHAEYFDNARFIALHMQPDANMAVCRYSHDAFISTLIFRRDWAFGRARTHCITITILMLRDYHSTLMAKMSLVASLYAASKSIVPQISRQCLIT